MLYLYHSLYTLKCKCTEIIQTALKMIEKSTYSRCKWGVTHCILASFVLLYCRCTQI